MEGPLPEPRQTLDSSNATKHSRMRWGPRGKHPGFIPHVQQYVGDFIQEIYLRASGIVISEAGL